MSRIFRAAALLALAPVTLIGQAPAPLMQPAAHETVELAEGVHAILRRDPPDDAANANVLVIVNAEDVIVVDSTLTASSADATVAAIRRLSDKPVRYVINTHWHDDHVLGNGTYAAAFPGVEFVGHPFARQQVIEGVGPALERNRTAYAEELAALEDRMARGIRRDGQPSTPEERVAAVRTATLFRAFLAEIPRIRLVPPSLTVSDALTLHRGDREIRIQFLGRGNTAGDLIVHLPKERIVATGDLLVHPIPFSFGSFLTDWIATLDRLGALEARVMMPGHGELQRDAAYLRSVRQLLTFVRDHMREAVERGLTLDQARASLQLDAFRARFAGSDAIRQRQFEQFFVAPATERAYLEATGEIQ